MNTTMNTTMNTNATTNTATPTTERNGVPTDKLAGYSPRLRRLLGFDLYRGIMGHVEGRSPAAALGIGDGEGDGRAYGASTDDNPFGDPEVARSASP